MEFSKQRRRRSVDSLPVLQRRGFADKAEARGRGLALPARRITDNLAAANRPKEGIAGNFDPIRDLTPISLLGTTATLLIVNKALGVKSVPELVALAERRRISCGSTAVGSSLHLACVMFKKAAGRDMTLIPYRSVTQLLTDTTAGRVDMMFMGHSSIAPHLKPDGAFAAIAVASAARSALAPELPTLAELGYPDLVLGAWYGIYAPAATPKSVVAQLNQAIDDPADAGHPATRSAARTRDRRRSAQPDGANI